MKATGTILARIGKKEFENTGESFVKDKLQEINKYYSNGRYESTLKEVESIFKSEKIEGEKAARLDEHMAMHLREITEGLQQGNYESILQTVVDLLESSWNYFEDYDLYKIFKEEKA